MRYARYALISLVAMNREMGSHGLSAYLEQIVRSDIDESFKDDIYDALAGVCLGEGDIDAAVFACEAILKRAPGSSYEYHALFKLFNIYYQDLQDKEQAAIVLDELVSMYPDYELTQIAQFDMGEEVDWTLARKFSAEEEPLAREVLLPEEYSLGVNYPNPFNPTTTIHYDLPKASEVTLVIYDIMGREVMHWDRQELPGYRSLVWNGRNRRGQLVPSGIYIYRLVAASTEDDQRFTASWKMVLLK